METFLKGVSYPFLRSYWTVLNRLTKLLWQMASHCCVFWVLVLNKLSALLDANPLVHPGNIYSSFYSSIITLQGNLSWTTIWYPATPGRTAHLPLLCPHYTLHRLPLPTWKTFMPRLWTRRIETMPSTMPDTQSVLNTYLLNYRNFSLI